jgi:hypothetical protein
MWIITPVDERETHPFDVIRHRRINVRHRQIHRVTLIA